MNYEYSACSAKPRLLILLTDELEESVKVVNSIIDRIIEANYDGESPKNRFFIIVIGYNQETHIMLSGFLRELDEHPIRINTEKVNVSDGAGGVVSIKRHIPIWIDSQRNQPDISFYPRAICLTRELVKKWLNDKKVPAPIVIDCSNEAYVEYAISEIEGLMKIPSRDGLTLFFGTYSNEKKDIPNVFSKMPEAWEYRFYNQDIKESEYCDGVLNRNRIIDIVSALTYVGGEPAIPDLIDKNESKSIYNT